MAAGQGFSRTNTFFSRAKASVRATSAREKRPRPLAEPRIYRSERATEADGATNTKR